MDYLTKIIADSEEAKKKLPKLLALEKRKFLAAIGKAEPIEYSTEHQAFAQDLKEKLNPMAISSVLNSKWKDSILETRKVLHTDRQFDTDTYLNCVKFIYCVYLNLVPVYKFSSSAVDQAFSYVLCHARCFGKPPTRLFEFAESDPTLPTIPEAILKEELPVNTTYMKTINELLASLRQSFSEKKYQQLNLNVTYLISLMMRRLVKSDKEFSKALASADTHDKYRKLCPLAVDTCLPMISDNFNKHFMNTFLNDAKLLIIDAYLNCKDFKTKRVFKATCIQYMEGNGLGLPTLFFKVIDLYNVEESELWDALASCKGIGEPDTPVSISKSLLKLADLYDLQYRASKSDPPDTFRWFYFCRLVGSCYHDGLAAKENRLICYVLSVLVDLKLGFDKSSARHAHWTSKIFLKGRGEYIAHKIYEELSK